MIIDYLYESGLVSSDVVVSSDSTLEELNLDLFDLMEILLSMEKALDVAFMDCPIDDLKTIGDIERYVESQRGGI